MPWSEKLEQYDATKMREGTTGVSVVPQSDVQAAVTYEVIFRQEQQMVRALVLEVWRKEDGEWRIIRWYEEKGGK